MRSAFMVTNDFKIKQQDLTELNGDGNRDRGRNGEDLKEEMPSVLKILKENTIAKLVKGEVVVTFNKINGDKRVMTCTLQEGVVPEATKKDPASQKKVQKINEEVQVVWDVNAKGWRSFRWANVTEVASV
ncbi:MAG: hypothetical protein CMO44_15090 [Verrucomicrobiales bacterium]|nr:hypothetical protein [Verrucomicrobiales bacterium]|tara:strand:+ start:1149 stop:1538 length:390 start_codon:yes stop_codon:yes gene_type:complete